MTFSAACKAWNLQGGVDSVLPVDSLVGECDDGVRYVEGDAGDGEGREERRDGVLVHVRRQIGHAHRRLARACTPSCSVVPFHTHRRAPASAARRTRPPARGWHSCPHPAAGWQAATRACLRRPPRAARSAGPVCKYTLSLALLTRPSSPHPGLPLAISAERRAIHWMMLCRACNRCLLLPRLHPAHLGPVDAGCVEPCDGIVHQDALSDESEPAGVSLASPLCPVSTHWLLSFFIHSYSSDPSCGRMCTTRCTDGCCVWICNAQSLHADAHPAVASARTRSPCGTHSSLPTCRRWPRA